MKCHYCDRDAVTTVGEYLKRDVCALCAEACGHAAAWVETVLPATALDRIFRGDKPPQKH